MSAKQFDDLLDNLVSQSYEYGDGTPIAHDVVAHRAALASLRAELATAQQRNRECYVKGWETAREAACREVCWSCRSSIDLIDYKIGNKTFHDQHVNGVLCTAINIRALTPPPGCGDCNTTGVGQS